MALKVDPVRSRCALGGPNRNIEGRADRGGRIVHRRSPTARTIRSIRSQSLRSRPPGAWSRRVGIAYARGCRQDGIEWKYLTVRRTALFLEESLHRGMQSGVLEPNDEPLGAKIRAYDWSVRRQRHVFGLSQRVPVGQP